MFSITESKFKGKKKEKIVEILVFVLKIYLRIQVFFLRNMEIVYDNYEETNINFKIRKLKLKVPFGNHFSFKPCVVTIWFLN